MAKFKLSTITDLVKPILGAVGIGAVASQIGGLASDTMPLFMMMAGGLILLVLLKKK